MKQGFENEVFEKTCLEIWDIIDSDIRRLAEHPSLQ